MIELGWACVENAKYKFVKKRYLLENPVEKDSGEANLGKKMALVMSKY